MKTIGGTIMAAKMPPIHPGEVLSEDFLKPLGINAYSLALAIKVPPNRISLILNGQRGITADTARRLGRYFGTSAQFWMNHQTRYDLETLEDFAGAKIDAEVTPRQATG
jgi:addiction module HigA family antidote